MPLSPEMFSQIIFNIFGMQNPYMHIRNVHGQPEAPPSVQPEGK
jgi:hypothetical protein